MTEIVAFSERVTEEFRLIQEEICDTLERFDGKSKFREDIWERPGGGGGRTRIISNGDVLEKGGVNFSSVHGTLPEAIAKSLELPGREFFATGVSIVLHPVNPHVPIIHMNIRYFETGKPDGTENKVWWFGGGIDLTPHYIDTADARNFHRALKMVCDRHHSDFYDKFKKWADDYFFIKHRNETRGIGGIFFDRLDQQSGLKRDNLFDFVSDVGRLFAPLYTEIAAAHRNTLWSDMEKEWQMIRRGRYVEFNLVYDRGTKFGLETGGRIESILMSLPDTARWLYDHQPVPGSAEAYTLQLLKKEIDWINWPESKSVI